MNIWPAVILMTLLQVAIGVASACGLGFADRAAHLSQVVVSRSSVRFDTSDILAIAFSLFIFWTVGSNRLEANQGLAGFSAVMTGTGVKALIQALLPLTLAQ